MHFARLTPRQLWKAAQGELELKLTRPVYETWVRHVTAVEIDGDTLLLRAPSTFAKEWIESRLSSEIKGTISKINGQPLDLSVLVGQADPNSSTQDPASSVVTAETPSNPPDEQVLLSPPRTDVWRPNRKYTFEHFIVGAGNQLAHAAAQAVAREPGGAFNPLFIHGGVGLGKTHLLHAIAHAILESGRSVVYISSEQFTNDLIQSIRHNRTQEFRDRYRSVDVLLVDDIQFIAGKESTQEEFFHTFDTLHSSGRQVVISADRSPKAISTLAERLKSRFGWGLVADIQPPDLETRQAILIAKARELHLAVPPPIMRFLAGRIHSNIRDLEGALNRISATATLTARPIDADLVAECIADLVPAEVRRPMQPEEIIDLVARHLKVDPVIIRGKSRGGKIVSARQMAMYLLREELGVSLAEIGRLLGGRDHSTVLHACNRVTDNLEKNDRVRRDLAAIRESLRTKSVRI